jgi:hypothetical protein
MGSSSAYCSIPKKKPKNRCSRLSLASPSVLIRRISQAERISSGQHITNQKAAEGQ